MEETDLNFRNKVDAPGTGSLALTCLPKVCDHSCVTQARLEGSAEPVSARWRATHTYRESRRKVLRRQVRLELASTSRIQRSALCGRKTVI